jgi:site-specific DNA-methyltransferase (adenine-specific)
LLNQIDKKNLQKNLKKVNSPVRLNEILNKTILGELDIVIPHLPERFVDLLFLDPPYNLNKTFNGQKFSMHSSPEYESLLDRWLKPLIRLLKPTSSVYICGDWRSSAAIYNVCSKNFEIQNRITWEREKGRGAKANWKNCAEDIWFCTMSDDFTFNSENVKIRRTVLAPYRDTNGQPKDWSSNAKGSYRDTAPSNIWTDLTVPFWSMPENTEHPTQKPEKLLAKIILGSSLENDIILDPFLGSGTTSVVAKKLGRRYVGIERELEYCLLAEKRLILAAHDKRIQGFEDGVFWERNSLKRLKKK